jgi:hypothetical protein
MGPVTNIIRVPVARQIEIQQATLPYLGEHINSYDQSNFLLVSTLTLNLLLRYHKQININNKQIKTKKEQTSPRYLLGWRVGNNEMQFDQRRTNCLKKCDDEKSSGIFSVAKNKCTSQFRCTQDTGPVSLLNGIFAHNFFPKTPKLNQTFTSSVVQSSFLQVNSSMSQTLEYHQRLPLRRNERDLQLSHPLSLQCSPSLNSFSFTGTGAPLR